MSISTQELQLLVNSGASVTIDATKFAARDLMLFANAMGEGACMTLRNAHRMAMRDRQIIANSAGPRVNFVFE